MPKWRYRNLSFVNVFMESSTCATTGNRLLLASWAAGSQAILYRPFSLFVLAGRSVDVGADESRALEPGNI